MTAENDPRCFAMIASPALRECLTCRRRKAETRYSVMAESVLRCSKLTPQQFDQVNVYYQICQNCGATYETFGRSPSEIVASTASSSPGDSAYASDFEVSIVLPREADVGFFVLNQIEVRCLETYLPRTGTVLSDVKKSWMWTILDLTDYGRALSCSFAALSLARVGMVRKDESLIMQARAQYSLALTSLQKALYDPELAFQDRTLAAIRTLSIYEVLSLVLLGLCTLTGQQLFAPTFAPVPRGHVHEEGMARWCVAAGPRIIKTEFAMQVFHDVRWCIVR